MQATLGRFDDQSSCFVTDAMGEMLWSYRTVEFTVIEFRSIFERSSLEPYGL